MMRAFHAFVLCAFHFACRYRLSRFMVVGATCAALNNALIIGLAALGAHYLTAALIAFAPVALTGYMMHASFTFERSGSPASFLRYAVMGAMNFPIWYAGMFLVCDIVGAPVAVGSPTATLLAFAWNYASAHWVFLLPIKSISQDIGVHKPAQAPAMTAKRRKAIAQDVSRMQVNRAVEGNSAEAKAGIALFSAYYPSHGGGMELATWELANTLLAAGLKLEWASLADNEPLPDLDAYCRPLPGTDLIYALSGVPMPLPTPRAIPEISRIVGRADVVVIVEANFVFSVVAFLAAKLHGKPVLLVQHVGKPSTVSPFARLVMSAGETLAVRPMVRRADFVVYVSAVVADYFEGEHKASTCLTIGHGIDLDKFFPAASDEERAADRAALGLPMDGMLACFVGRLTESKGVSVIAEMARLRPDWNFVLAGKGPVDPEKWGLPNIFALGQLNRTEVARLYRASAATVLPSPSESFSLVVREALASGSHVVCSPQILETDAGLAPYITTELVDLSDVAGTAARFAAAVERSAPAPGNQARDYIATQCSKLAINEQYTRLVKHLLRPGRNRNLEAVAVSEPSSCR